MPRNSDSLADSPKFSADALRKAIQTEPMLGRPAIDAIIDDLENQGIRVTNAHAQYGIEEIQVALENIFGAETTSFLIRHITEALID